MNPKNPGAADNRRRRINKTVRLRFVYLIYSFIGDDVLGFGTSSMFVLFEWLSLTMLTSRGGMAAMDSRVDLDLVLLVIRWPSPSSSIWSYKTR